MRAVRWHRRGDVPDSALTVVRPGGRVVLVGLPSAPCAVDLKRLVLRELSLIGSVGHIYDQDTRTAVALLCDRRVDPAPLITHRPPLEEAVHGGIAYLAGSGRATALKILISPRLPRSTPATASIGPGSGADPAAAGS